MAFSVNPTVVPYAEFSASSDGDTLRAAMKGFGTDEQTIIDILTSRSNSQRQQIGQYFTNSLGRDIIDDLKSELGGKFEDVIVGLMLQPDQYLCKQLNKAMDGIGTNESTLVEILCTKSNEEVKRLVSVYEDMYDRPLAEHLCSETDGYFRRLLTLIITGVRDETGTINPDEAKEQAAALYAAGEAKLGTDEEVFNRIFSHSSFAQLRLVFEEYKSLSGQTIEQAVKHEMGGELKEAIMAIIECVQSPSAFFAKRLNDAMSGAGTDDSTLIRIIVSRSEIDLGTIKDEYERIYNRTLLSAVKNETSGDYKHALCAIIGDA
ncbi:annexin B10-like [Bradysia coprophila]|uniref:annexin B10-like n=1 Tax=Bradysia coprophila TaxID=38358 RepID=UPI00187D825B|nr:annexin B10-like [Bradysia coprophila]